MQHLHFRGHGLVVLFSAQSRAAYARQAVDKGGTYAFIGAAGEPRVWVKGEFAYLAPNAADLLLSRCNLKHDVVEEGELSAAVLERCRALLIPNAAHLSERTIGLVENRPLGPLRRCTTAQCSATRLVGARDFRGEHYPVLAENSDRSGSVDRKPVASFGLILVILRGRAAPASSMIACYIACAYWFTASTSFANPAVAFGRVFSESFARSEQFQ
jgi:hypothetical protein